MKIKETDFEVFFGYAYNVFNKVEYDYQGLYLIKLCIEYLGFNNDNFPRNVEIVKKKYFKWQSEEQPKTLWISESCKSFANMKELSHNDDLTWNDLTFYINNYSVTYLPEIKCNTYQESLRDAIFEKKDDDWLRNAPL